MDKIKLSEILAHHFIATLVTVASGLYTPFSLVFLCNRTFSSLIPPWDYTLEKVFQNNKSKHSNVSLASRI